MSILFYAAGEKSWVLILLLSILSNYYCAFIINKGIESGNVIYKKTGLFLSVVTNLGALFFFKYLAFFIQNYNTIVVSIDLSSMEIKHFVDVVLPLGISFYSFQAMSYNIDVYRGEVKVSRSFINFACYITMFSQLVAGPIVRYRDMSEQLSERIVKMGMVRYGLKRFILGLSKKVLIANTLSIPVDKIFSLPESQLTSSISWFGAILYSLQIYFDFSGYSDMAIGIGKMFGFTFPENFNYPYISKSIQDFWRRWHISLSTWFRDYLYVPLGGNRISTQRTYFNLLIVFLLCGFWHGASWTFIVWGLYHGVFLIFERLGPGKFFEKKNRIIGYCYALPVIVVGWVIFRAENFSQTFYYLFAMAGFGQQSELSSIEIFMFLTTDVIVALSAGILFSIPIYPAIEQAIDKILSFSKKYLYLEILNRGFYLAIFISFFIYASILIASGRENPFIYFRF